MQETINNVNNSNNISMNESSDFTASEPPAKRLKSETGGFVSKVNEQEADEAMMRIVEDDDEEESEEAEENSPQYSDKAHQANSDTTHSSASVTPTPNTTAPLANLVAASTALLVKQQESSISTDNNNISYSKEESSFTIKKEINDVTMIDTLDDRESLVNQLNDNQVEMEDFSDIAKSVTDQIVTNVSLMF